MIFLRMDGQGLEILVYLIALFWLIPIGLGITGFVIKKSRPKSSKILLTIAGIWLIVGFGFCGSMMG